VLEGHEGVEVFDFVFGAEVLTEFFFGFDGEVAGLECFFDEFTDGGHRSFFRFVCCMEYGVFLGFFG